MTTGVQALPPEALRRIQWAVVSCIVMPVLGAIYLVYAELWLATWVMAL